MKNCVNCHIMKNLDCFRIREDRINGRYVFCDDCMVEQARGPDWPANKERGGGLLFWDIDKQ